MKKWEMVKPWAIGVAIGTAGAYLLYLGAFAISFFLHNRSSTNNLNIFDIVDMLGWVTPPLWMILLPVLAGLVIAFQTAKGIQQNQYALATWGFSFIIGTIIAIFLYLGLFSIRMALAMLGNLWTPNWLMVIPILLGAVYAVLTAKRMAMNKYGLAYLGIVLALLGATLWWWI